ncbi:hypothetical protein WME91_51600 [Sorangium sp. So ce269]
MTPSSDEPEPDIDVVPHDPAWPGIVDRARDARGLPRIDVWED